MGYTLPTASLWFHFRLVAILCFSQRYELLIRTGTTAQHAGMTAQNEWNTQKSNADSIIARGTGGRVCKKSGTHSLFTGFVEQFEKERMQIRVVDKLTSGFSQNGFTPVYVWDEIGNWSPCDTQTERELLSH